MQKAPSFQRRFNFYNLAVFLVGAEGIGPSASVLSGQRSTTELRARKIFFQYQIYYQIFLKYQGS